MAWTLPICDDDVAGLHRALVLPRMIEERMLILLRQGHLSKWFSGIGQEAVSVGVTSALRPDDYILPMHRNLGVFTTRGVDLNRLYRQLLGREGGFTRGRDRSFHFADLDRNIVGMISHLGAMLPVACGLGLAAQLSESKQVALAFFGDGASSEGDVHEACNLAAVWTLPVIFLIENNQYGLSTPVREQYACTRLVDRAEGYGMPGVFVDGNDLIAVRKAVSAAAERARRGDGPSLIECETFRMRGHEEASGIAYVPQELRSHWAQQDPIARFEHVALAAGKLTEAAIKVCRQSVFDEVRDDIDQALMAGSVSSTADIELSDVYAPLSSNVESLDVSYRSMRYIDAITDALDVQMTGDASTILMGQDIAEYGGVFKVTEGFIERFGAARVRNTPIIESGAIGAAMGLALAGFRPMVEMQFADFITCGFNQIVNNLAKTHYRWNAQLPIVIRAPHGGGVGAGPFHSQSVEAWFTSVAGLKVVSPATPGDAKGLLLAAFQDPNPVLFLEHKKLYRSTEGPVAVGYVTTPIGQARFARTGQDVSVVTYGVGVHWALDAADILAGEDIDVEIIDLRTLIPWDRNSVVQSVQKTGRALVVHEAPTTGGFGGELASTIGELAFEWLDAPVRRLGALDTPVPFARSLEAIHSPATRLVDAIRALVRY